MSTYGGFIEKLSRKVEARLGDIEAIFNFDFGDEFEVAICALLEDILPARFGVCRGFVVAESGKKAGDDLIIYDKLYAPTLRSNIGRQFSVKEQIPIEAVYGYIECKHAIEQFHVLEKAIDQVRSVKELLLTRRGRKNSEYEKDGPIENGEVKKWPRSFPPLKNQPYCAIFTRRYNSGIEMPDTGDDFTPDLMILGSDHIATHSVRLDDDETKSTLFYDAAHGGGLMVERVKSNAFGLGLVMLLQALSWIELEPLDWTVTLEAGFSATAVNRDD
jgi:hypothetical protein